MGIKSLAKINGDLARLGNLLLLALDDQEFKATLSDGQVEDALEIFYSIRKTQDVLKQKIKEL